MVLRDPTLELLKREHTRHLSQTRHCAEDIIPVEMDKPLQASRLQVLFPYAIPETNLEPQMYTTKTQLCLKSGLWKSSSVCQRVTSMVEINLDPAVWGMAT